MEYKKVSVTNEKSDLCKYFLSFFEEIDDVFPDLCSNPMSSLTEEKNQEALKFYIENNENETLNVFLDDVLKCDIIYSLLKEKNQKKDIVIEIIDIPLFNTYLLRSISDAIALGNVFHLDPKTLILYGFIYANIYSKRVLEDKKSFKEYKHSICRPLEKMFKKDYSLIYYNKMYQSYCEAFETRKI